MPRPVRVEFPGAIYHVMARGNNGQRIFADDSDRQTFLRTLAESVEKTGWQVHAYVLMFNHYHLLVETPEGNLVEGMKWLQGTYTQRYNSRHQIGGHLFQGRYKAIPVDPEDSSYLQFVSTYIHLNPARAKLVRGGKDKLSIYRWSSYPAYLSRKGPDWLCRRKVLASLNLKEGQTRGYEAYMEGRVLELGIKAGRRDLEEKWRQLRRGWYVGEQGFRQKLERLMEKALAGKERSSHSGAARQGHDIASAEKWLAQGMKALELSKKDLAELPLGAPEKVVLAWWLRTHTPVPLKWVAMKLSMGHYTRAGHAVSRMNHKPGRKLLMLREKLAKLQGNEGKIDERR